MHQKTIYMVFYHILLRGQNYTKASDIYSIDIIMNKVISELSPYHDVSYDNKNL